MHISRHQRGFYVRAAAYEEVERVQAHERGYACLPACRQCICQCTRVNTRGGLVHKIPLYVRAKRLSAFKRPNEATLPACHQCVCNAHCSTCGRRHAASIALHVRTAYSAIIAHQNRPLICWRGTRSEACGRSTRRVGSDSSRVAAHWIFSRRVAFNSTLLNVFIYIIISFYLFLLQNMYIM